MAYTIPPQTSPSSSFAQRLTSATIRTGSILCVGIDPHPGLMPELFGGPYRAAGSNRAIKNFRGVRSLCVGCCFRAGAGDKAASGLFERHGPEGPTYTSQSFNCGQAT